MNKSLTVQILATAIVSFQASQTGFIIGWPSNTVAIFSSNSTVLSKQMSTLEISLFGSLVNVGGLLTAPFCGTVFNKLGRKYATVFFGLPFVLAWATVAVTSDVSLVLAAVALAGAGAAGQAASPIFIAELAEDAVRGSLSACSGTGYFVGILLSYIFGGYFPYHTVVYILLSLSVLSVILLLVMKESPVYLVMVGQEEEAAKSLAFYRWTDATSREVQAEIMKIKRQIDPNLEKMLMADKESQPATDGKAEDSKQGPIESKTQDSLKEQFKFLKNSRSSKRALMVVLTLVCMSILMGSLAVQVYAEPLFKKAAPSLSPNSCAVLLAVVFLVASLLCVLLVDRCGRRFLLVVSSLVSGVSTLLLGAQLQLRWAPPWLSALLIYVYSFGYTLGAAVVPFVIMSEVFLPEVRGLCNSIGLLVQWSVGFVALMLFNESLALVGPAPIFYAFSAVCFGCVVFTCRCLPELRGLSVDQIQLAFLKGSK